MSRARRASGGREVTLTLPTLHAGQREIAPHARRYNVLACGRRFGKSTFAIDRLLHPALAGYPVSYFAPTYKMLSEVWREMVRTAAPVTLRTNTQEHRLELVTGGVIDFWSLDNPNSARGRRYKRVFVDEAAMIAALKEAWQAVIRPTLTDFQGDAWFGSTPKGLNYFYTLFQYGQDENREDWASWQMPTVANPHIRESEVEAARLELPEETFAQEYLARFLAGEGRVFRRVRERMVAPADSSPETHRQHRPVMGVDWAKDQDFTALSVFCPRCAVELELDRFNKIDWSFQRARLRSLGEKWGVVYYLAEANSIGGPNIEALQYEGLPIAGFDTTSSSKPPLIQSLALCLERGEAEWLPVEVATAELEAYEVKYTALGRPSYSAPEGGHDDTVIARALAWRAALEGSPAIGADTVGAWVGVGA